MERGRWDLRGMRCVVTGASQGLGYAIAREMLTLGATVLLVGRSAQKLRDAQNALADETDDKTGDACFCFAADVATDEGRASVLEHVEKLFGSLDVLVNNVGVNRRAPIEEVTGADYDLTVRTNQDSAFFLCQQFFPMLRRSSAASVVNVASVAGVRSTGTGVLYAMTKAAMVHMSEALACEWGHYGIRVNCVAPWMTMTPLLNQAIAGDESQLDAPIAATPLGRLGSPEDTAGAVCFLCMPAARYVTGQTLCVDGGLVAQGFRGPCVKRAAQRAQRATDSAKSSATSRVTVPKKRDADALFMEFLDKSVKKLENQQNQPQAQSVATTSTAPVAATLASEIEALVKLHKKGVLTEDQLAAGKKKLLGISE